MSQALNSANQMPNSRVLQSCLQWRSVSLSKYTVVSCVLWFISEFVSFDAETFSLEYTAWRWHRQWWAVFVDMRASRFFSHLLLDRQKGEYLCSFPEVVPRLVILCHLLQPVVHHLLKLFVIIIIAASLSTWFWVSVSNQDYTDGFLISYDFFCGLFWVP